VSVGFHIQAHKNAVAYGKAWMLMTDRITIGAWFKWFAFVGWARPDLRLSYMVAGKSDGSRGRRLKAGSNCGNTQAFFDPTGMYTPPARNSESKESGPGPIIPNDGSCITIDSEDNPKTGAE
jgi:hypothetical protein